MGWRYVYGCNIHRGAEGDNSKANFGITRRKCSEDGEGKRWHAMITATSPTPHHIAEATAKPRSLYHNTDIDSNSVYVGAAKDRRKATLNTDSCPELHAMYELSKGRLPSRRLQFHFPDLFPEIEEEEGPSQKRIYYQEPPRLVNSERLLRWMVPSVPWRYLKRRAYAPLSLTRETRDVEDDASPRTRLDVTATPRGLDVGCQTTADVGIQVDVELVPETKAEVVVVESLPVTHVTPHSCDRSVQTETCTLKQRPAARPKRRKTKKVLRSPPSVHPSPKPLVQSVTPTQGIAQMSSEATNKDSITQKQSSSKEAGHEMQEPHTRDAEDVVGTGAGNGVAPPLTETETAVNDILKQDEHLSDHICKDKPHKRQPPLTVTQTTKHDNMTKASLKPQKYQLKIAPSRAPEIKEVIPRTNKPPCINKQHGNYDSHHDGSSIANSTREAVIHSIPEHPIHSNPDVMTPMSVASSLESLEELERLIESQHAQLVAKGLLPPDIEIEGKESKDSHPLEASQFTWTAESERHQQGDVREDDASHSHSFSFDDSLADSSFSEILEHLGMTASDDAPIVHVSTDSSEMERSTAAALAALTRYQSQTEPTDVVYDVQITKEDA